MGLILSCLSLVRYIYMCLSCLTFISPFASVTEVASANERGFEYTYEYECHFSQEVRCIKFDGVQFFPTSKNNAWSCRYEVWYAYLQ